MKKVYIGIDAHKESNVLALAFAGTGAPESYGKASADLKAFEAVLRRIMKKHDLSKEDKSKLRRIEKSTDMSIPCMRNNTAHPACALSPSGNGRYGPFPILGKHGDKFFCPVDKTSAI